MKNEHEENLSEGELERTETRFRIWQRGVQIARKIAVARSRASYGCSAEF